MKKTLALAICLLASSSLATIAQDDSDRWVGNYNGKGKTDAIARRISIVRDDKDIKAKFFGPQSPTVADYLGEGVAEWYPAKNGRGAYVTDFMKDGARMHVVIVPNSKNNLHVSFCTKYDDKRNNLYWAQDFSRTK